MDVSSYELLQARILSHYESALAIMDGGMPPPRMAIVYPSYKCTFNCRGCEYISANRKGVLFESKAFLDLFGRLRDLGVKSVEFCGGGEPSLHPDLGRAVRRAAGLGLSIGLLSNGINVKGALAGALLECASYVRIGVDAATEATFLKHKAGAGRPDFKAVWKNLARLAQRKAETGSRTLLSAKFLVSRDNFREMEAFAQRASALGLDSIQFKALRNGPNELDPATLKTLQAKLGELRACSPVPIVGSLEKTRIRTKCWLTPLYMVIDPLGDVYLCCYYLHRSDRHRIGNVHEQSLEQIWLSDRHRSAIKGIKPAECNLYDCRFHKYNAIMDAAVKKGLAQMEFL